MRTLFLTLAMLVSVSLVGCMSSTEVAVSPEAARDGAKADSAETRSVSSTSPSTTDTRVPEIMAADWLNTRQPVSLTGLRGKVVMVEFWATWCPPCVQGIPHLNELQERYGDQGFQIVSLTDEDRSTVTGFQKKRELEMNYIIGMGSKTGAEYGVRSIPHAVIIDREGQMLWRGHPADPECEMQIEVALGRG